MGAQQSKNDEPKSDFKKKLHEKHEMFMTKQFMKLTNGSHDMYDFMQKTRTLHKFIECYGNITEKDTTVSYRDNSESLFHGKLTIFLNDYESKDEDSYVFIAMYVQQNCVHDVDNEQYTVYCHDPNKPYKIELYTSYNEYKKRQGISRLSYDEMKTHNGIVVMLLHTNLKYIIGNEPSRKDILNILDDVLTNDFFEKNNSVGNLMNEILNGKNTQLREFLLNEKKYDMYNIPVATIVE